ncbi:MAG: tRNA (adenosine(37)-N6)-threonylcarbamoyltransferase complex transferase subunit TsaD [Candidatus Moranbacteria bacterium]|nr:tRNA (adenosine(37)-N6)-threonylcarbamoyltransferase complex transferase subunit TsaD [Candidatus Moranbacteria bacterium]
MTKVLSIETSCDETACAVLESTPDGIKVLANIVSSQADLHASYGGVVPQLAAREHINNIVPVVAETLAEAKLSKDAIDFIAVTEGPGLMPALLIGVNAAKTLSLVWDKPLMGVQHLEGHIYANLLREDTSLVFPLIALIVSGGHTELVLMEDHFQYTILGETQDDASGEAFDKVAKLLGLPYPGGPQVAKRADAFRQSHEKEAIQAVTDRFPRPMLAADNYDFSFSGLKTAVLYAVQKEAPLADDPTLFTDSICHAFQEAAIDVLVGKTKKALSFYSPATFVIAGGVSANTRLREQLTTLIATHFPETTFLTPEFKYSLDNAAMIGSAALMRFDTLSKEEIQALKTNTLTLDPNPNLPLHS